MAERFLAATFNRPGHEIIDHYTYVLASDGDLMEGDLARGGVVRGAPAARQADRAVRLQPGVSSTGRRTWRSPRTSGKRFEAYGWHVQRIDGMDYDAVDGALHGAHRRDERPSMIVARTHIGYGSPNKADSSKAHGSPLGEEEVALTKRAYGWPEDKQFFVPDEALAHFRKALDRGAARATSVAGAVRRVRGGASDGRGDSCATRSRAGCRTAGT